MDYSKTKLKKDGTPKKLSPQAKLLVESSMAGGPNELKSALYSAGQNDYAEKVLPMIEELTKKVDALSNKNPFNNDENTVFPSNQLNN